MFALGWQYMTGRAVAAAADARDLPEWPPHPDRVFKALVAAWGETGASDEGRAALQWLERQSAPALAVPQEGKVPTGLLEVYVPVNDAMGLDTLPIRRTRKGRSFPFALPGDRPCFLIFPEADPGPHRAALETICRSVTHIGHSRSLVRMWIEDDPPPPNLVPRSSRQTTHHLGVFYQGRLAELEEDHRVLYPGPLEEETGKDRQSGNGKSPPPPVRSHARGQFIPYGPPGGTVSQQGDFEPRVLVLRRVEGAQASLPRSLSWLEVLRKALLLAADQHPEWRRLVSGHEASGQAMNAPHLALVPLADVGHPHADGHLMGFGILFPRDLSRDLETDFLWGVLPQVFQGDPARIRLVAGEAGEMLLDRESRPVPPRTLQAITWTRSSARWASVTPVVLDRQPPRRHEDQDAWAMDQVRQACLRQGLPEPEEVRVSPVSFVLGSPPARAFPPLPRRGDGGHRWHLHAEIRFAEQVSGPIVLGAGRYRGYGLFRPMGGP